METRFQPLLVLMLLLAGRSALSAEVSYRINEESNLRATVGNIWKSLAGVGTVPAFSIVPKSDYFDIDADGNVRIRAQIDREDKVACPAASESTPCVIEFNAFRGASSRILVRVTIDDINDNSPVFKEPQKILSIEEGDVNFRHPLDLATDADVGNNGMATRGQYFLRDDAGGIFDLAQTDPGFLSLTLKGHPNIDYETEKQYNLTLTACDAGREQRCSSQLLIVQVKDRNDNSPNVTRILVAEVSENLAIGGLVATIEAQDRDSGRNAELDFSITNPELARVFDIDRSGRVTLKKPLNAKKQAAYEVQLMVSDNGSPRRQTPAKFKLQVADINDHAPNIEVSPMSTAEGGQQPQQSEDILVPENTPSGILALIEAKDEDLGENARVECQLASEGDRKNFRLEGIGKGQYMLHLRSAFDYENSPSESVRVNCHDFGRPPKNSTKRLLVRFRNANEFRPKFGDSMPTRTSVEETRGDSSPPDNLGRAVLRLAATDRDRDDVMTFSLDDSPDAAFFEVANAASSYSESRGLTEARAELRIRSPIDRDVMPEASGGLLKFGVRLTDTSDASGVQHSASVSLTVSVVDVNDNRPEVLPPLVFRLREDARPGSGAVGWPGEAQRLASLDADQGVNAQVFYRLLRLEARPSQPSQPSRDSPPLVIFDKPDQWHFNVSESGAILSTRKLDRETFELYTLTVMVYNKLAMPQLNSTARVSLELIDVNDNPPEWFFPAERGHFVNISSAHSLNEPVTSVEARDRDRVSNITYTLVGRSEYFSVDPVTGQVRALQALVPGLHELSIRADDNVQYNHAVYTSLIVNVIPPSRTAGHLKDAQLNLTIIVAMVIATAVISVGLVFAIVCVRRRGSSGDSGIGGHCDGGLGDLGDERGGFLAEEFDKEACQCQCSLPDVEIGQMSPDHMYGHLCSGGTAKFGDAGTAGFVQRQQQQQQHQHFAMTTFSHNGSVYDLQPAVPPPMPSMPPMMDQQLRNEVVINQQDLDGDSADSGRGGSEDDHGSHLLGGLRSSSQLHHHHMHHHHHHLHPSSGFTNGGGGGGGVPPTASSASAASAGSGSSSMNAAACHCAGIPEEENSSCAGGDGDCPQQQSFLPPPLPPHGVVEFNSGGTLSRQTLSRQQQQQQQQPQRLNSFHGQPRIC